MGKKRARNGGQPWDIQEDPGGNGSLRERVKSKWLGAVCLDKRQKKKVYVPVS